MNTRDELAGIIKSPESFDGGPASCGPTSVYAARTADAILAAGYRKQAVVIEWGAAHANGVVARTYRTDRAAQAFVESMAEVGHEMKVLRREYRPATYTEWESA